jgi:CRISPR system Cascade subunit CasE
MYLSRIILDPRSRDLRHDVARPYEMHRTIMSAFPSALPAGAERVLFRLDIHPQTNALHLLVQSYLRPDWSHLQTKRYIATGLPDNPAVKEFYLNFRPGQPLAFRLLANPTKRLGKDFGADKGKRVGLYKPDQQEDWLHRKAKQHGFALLSVTMSAPQRLDDARNQIKLFSVRFDGTLRVVDSERFVAAIEQGIGSGKAFGFGLLSLAPAA